MRAALLASLLLACTCRAASRALLQAPAPPAARTLTVVNRCSEPLKVGLAYPFDNSDPTKGGWCTNFNDAWQTGWCYEKGAGLVPPGGVLTSNETTAPLPPTPSAFVTAYRHTFDEVYVPGYTGEESCLDTYSQVYCACTYLNCFAWFQTVIGTTVELRCREAAPPPAEGPGAPWLAPEAAPSPAPAGLPAP
jgi:hypothetical protein